MLTPDPLTHARKLIDQGNTPTEASKIMAMSRVILYRALQHGAAQRPTRRIELFFIQKALDVRTVIPYNQSNENQEHSASRAFASDRRR